jgi:predicted transcriptional regulator
MKTRRIKIGIKSWEENKRELREVFRGVTKGKKLPAEETLYFRDVATFRQCLTPQRLEVLWVTAEKHPGSIRELAALLGRQPKDVKGDLDYLAGVGLVEFRVAGLHRKTKVPVVPYDRMDLSFELRGRAA